MRSLSPVPSSLTLGALLAAGATTLPAQFTWDGGGGDANWTTDANWSGDVAPASGLGSTALVFDGATRLDATADEPFSFRSLSFAAGASAFTLSGSPLTLVSGSAIAGPHSFIRNDSSALQTIDNALTIDGQSALFIAASGDLRFGGDINLVNNGGYGLTLEGGTGRTIALAGALSGAGGEPLYITNWSGNVTVLLTGASSLTGDLSIATGTTLQLGDGGTTGSIASGINVLGFNGTLRVNRSDAVTLDQTFFGVGVLEHSGTGTVTLSGNSSQLGGRVRVNGGGLFVVGAQGAAGGIGDFEVSDGSTLRIGAGVSLAPNNDVAFDATGGSTVEIDGDVRGRGSFVNNEPGSEFSDSTLRVRDGGFLRDGLHAFTGASLLEVQTGGGLGSATFVFRDDSTFSLEAGAALSAATTFHFIGGETENRVLDLAGKSMPVGSLEFTRVTATLAEAGFHTGAGFFILNDGSEVSVTASDAWASTEGGVYVLGGSLLSLGAADALATPTLYVQGSGSLVEIAAAGALQADGVYLDGGGELRLNGHDLAIGSLSIYSGSQVTNNAAGAATLTLDTSRSPSGSYLYGQISDGAPGSGALSLTITGGGYVGLGAVQGYTGVTRVTGGATLGVIDYDETGGFVVQNRIDLDDGGRLAGSGPVREVNVNDGGILSPGDQEGDASVDTLFTQTVTLSGDTFFEFDLYDTSFDPDAPDNGGAVQGWDRLSVDGEFRFSASVGDTFTFVLRSGDEDWSTLLAADFDPAQSYSFGFLTASEGIVGFDPARTTIDASAFLNAFDGAWSLRQDGDTLYLDYVPVPEPASVAALAGFAALGLAALRRRRRHRA